VHASTHRCSTLCCGSYRAVEGLVRDTSSHANLFWGAWDSRSELAGCFQHFCIVGGSRCWHLGCRSGCRSGLCGQTCLGTATPQPANDVARSPKHVCSFNTHWVSKHHATCFRLKRSELSCSTFAREAMNRCAPSSLALTRLTSKADEPWSRKKCKVEGGGLRTDQASGVHSLTH
jgi:hypothetical protein